MVQSKDRVTDCVLRYTSFKNHPWSRIRDSMYMPNIIKRFADFMCYLYKYSLILKITNL